jgi:cytidylate kinase
LGACYLDTGAMYRAVTLAVLRAGVDPHDAETVAKIALEADLIIGTDPTDPHTTLDGTNVDGPIRSAEVTSSVSAVSAVPAVRQILVARQREIIAEARGGAGIVVEGRDIGSVVAPDAELKVFLTASEIERARRRSAEQAADLDATAADLRRRDHFDSTRATDPLAQVPDAVVLDSTEIGIDEVVAHLVALLQERHRT